VSYPRAHYKARVEYSGSLGKLCFFAQICLANASLCEGGRGALLECLCVNRCEWMEWVGAYPTLGECEKIILEQMLSLGDSVEMFSLFYVSYLFIRGLRFHLSVDKAVRKCVGSCPIL